MTTDEATRDADETRGWHVNSLTVLCVVLLLVMALDISPAGSHTPATSS